VILEAAPDQTHAIGKQGRSERITRIALIALAVKGEVDARATINLAAIGITEGLGHELPSPPSSFGAGSVMP
jgi:hypothetical protein